MSFLDSDLLNQIRQSEASKYLDDDQLWYCCKHGLSVNKEDYTEYELQMITTKALEEKERNRIYNSEKLRKL